MNTQKRVNTSITHLGRARSPAVGSAQIMAALAVLLASATSFHLNGAQVAHATPRAAVAPTMLSLPQIAAGANLATFGLYGTALLLKPGKLMKDVNLKAMSA